MAPFAPLFFLLIFLAGCASNPPDCPCQDNPCLEADDERFPLATVMQAYGGSSLGDLLPQGVKVTPAKVLYSLLEDGNSTDAATWKVGSDEKNPEYSGYIEVFPIERIKGAQCRKFTQKIKMHLNKYGDFSFKSHGKSCKRYPGTWTIVQEVQL